MKGLVYSGTNNAVQLSFERLSHENLSIDTVASVSSPITGEQIILSMAVAAHVRIGDGPATVADMILPAGVWPLHVINGSTVSLIKLSGSDSGQASVIIPKG